MNALSAVVFCFLAILLFDNVCSRSMSQGRSIHHDIAFIHTFDTREMCMSRCRTSCTQQHSEDLMMPRWQCPLQEEDNSEVDEEEESSLGGKLLIIIPCVILGSLLCLFFCVSAMQRFCRNDY